MNLKSIIEYLQRTGLSPAEQIKVYVKTADGLKLVELIQSDGDYLDKSGLGDLTGINLPCLIIEHEE